ncbi:MAG: Card1-like endonuclease domain-containing protein [Methanotrichaceae archaeon]
MRIMVCLISSQHVPNLLAIRTIKPDRLIFVVTSGMKGKESQLLKALAVGGMDYKSKRDIIDLAKGEEQFAEVIRFKLQNLFRKYSNEEWIINLTGGTKPMSIGAYEFSKEKGLRTLYIAEGNQSHATDLLGGPSVALSHKISTAEFLAGYGFDLLNVAGLKESEERAWLYKDLASLLAKNNEDEDLRSFLARLQDFKEAKIKLDDDDWEKNGLLLSEEDCVYLDNDYLRNKIAAQFGLSTVGSKFIGRLEKNAAEFLTGKWLEVFVWSQLLPFVDKGIIWDLHLGVNAGLNGPGENNDLDVSFMRDQSLCIVECKTGGQRHDPEANDVLYKIEAVKSGPKALRVETYLATTSDNVKDPHRRGIKEKLLRRSKIYGCSIIPGWKIKEIADLYLSNDPRLSSEVANAFGMKLEASH